MDFECLRIHHLQPRQTRGVVEPARFFCRLVKLVHPDDHRLQASRKSGTRSSGRSSAATQNARPPRRQFTAFAAGKTRIVVIPECRASAGRCKSPYHPARPCVPAALRAALESAQRDRSSADDIPAAYPEPPPGCLCAHLVVGVLRIEPARIIRKVCSNARATACRRRESSVSARDAGSYCSRQSRRGKAGWPQGWRAEEKIEKRPFRERRRSSAFRLPPFRLSPLILSSAAGL